MPMCACDQHLMATMSVSFTHLCVYDEFAYADTAQIDHFDGGSSSTCHGRSAQCVQPDDDDDDSDELPTSNHGRQRVPTEEERKFAYYKLKHCHIINKISGIRISQ